MSASGAPRWITLRARSPTECLPKVLLGLSGCPCGDRVFLFSSPKVISAAEVKLESAGATQGDTVLSASGYVVAHHKSAVGAKVMGRVAWIGVAKGDTVQQGQVLGRLEDNDFRAQSNQARANLAAAQARLDQLRTGSRPQEKLKDRAGVLQAEATLTNAEADYDRTEKLYRAGCHRNRVGSCAGPARYCPRFGRGCATIQFRLT